MYSVDIVGLPSRGHDTWVFGRERLASGEHFLILKRTTKPGLLFLSLMYKASGRRLVMPFKRRLFLLRTLLLFCFLYHKCLCSQTQQHTEEGQEDGYDGGVRPLEYDTDMLVGIVNKISTTSEWKRTRDGDEPTEIVFGQSAVFGGPSKDLGIEFRKGLWAAFNETNTLFGGIKGFPIRLISYDDILSFQLTCLQSSISLHYSPHVLLELRYDVLDCSVFFSTFLWTWTGLGQHT